MKAQNFILLLILLVSLASCNKKHNITIQAQDVITGDGSAYANMSFNVLEARTGVFEDKYETAYEGVLDENGYASFDLKMNRNRNYILFVSQPDNICHGGIFQYYLETENSNVVPINYLKCGQLNLPIINVNCENGQDKFRYKYYYTLDPDIYVYIGFLDPDLNWDYDDYLEGCIDYSTAQSFYERPVGNYTIEWMVERTSGTTFGIDTFSVHENDSTTYLIEY